jgi:ArsR family metal-binding transcriptional regulator
MEALIGEYQLELSAVECMPDVAVWSANAHIQNDVSEVMPYLNAVLDRALYDSENRNIIWKVGGRKYALRPHELAVSSILEREQAHDLVEQAVVEINRIWAQRDEITPDYSKRTPPKLLDILKHLPRTNCRECGVPSCMAFAAELIEGNKRLEDCPPLCEDANDEALRRLERLSL